MQQAGIESLLHGARQSVNGFAGRWGQKFARLRRNVAIQSGCLEHSFAFGLAVSTWLRFGLQDCWSQLNLEALHRPNGWACECTKPKIAGPQCGSRPVSSSGGDCLGRVWFVWLLLPASFRSRGGFLSFAL